MASMLETPSRIWRRIEAEDSRDMPSLPSVPAFDDSFENLSPSDDPGPYLTESDQEIEEQGVPATPIHSTPAASTIRAASSTSSTTRFANSLARSGRSSLAHSNASRAMSSRQRYPDSFEISAIPSLPEVEMQNRSDSLSGEMEELLGSQESAPEGFSPDRVRVDGDEERDLSLTDALESVSRTSSPYPGQDDVTRTPKERSFFDYEVPLKSSVKPSPFSTKFRNVAIRRPMLERTRTPSLTRTTVSPTSSPPNSTPRSSRSMVTDRSASVSPIPAASVPLPVSNAGSPAVHARSPEPNTSLPNPVLDTSMNGDSTTQSMDITDVHISPARQLPESESDQEEDHSGLLNESVRQTEGSSHEPTFSSDDGATPYASGRDRDVLQESHSPGGLASAFSSPAVSMATPTPAFPRPRARFNLPPDDSTERSEDGQQHSHEDTEEEDGGEADMSDEPVTPQTRRRSFFLSVINSTARPRMKLPTPHPRSRIPPDTPSGITATPGPNGRGTLFQNTPVALQTAFAGATPRPTFGGRLSHPLSQAYTASSSTSESESEAADATAAPEAPAHIPWSTPAAVASMTHHLSPYDDAGANGASFISTASSHDLTTHPRANTSFDPAMGFGGNAPGHGVGRFNAGKLNTYLHGLNRRLQEENEVLLERLRKVEEEKAKSGSAIVSATPAATIASSRRASGGSRRLSAVSNLGDLQEEAGEAWMEEKAELEEMVETFKNEAEQWMKEKEEVEKALEQATQERARDKERWKERMAEVQEGVEAIIRDLEAKMQAAEEEAKKARAEGSELASEFEKELAEVQAQRDDAAERAEKAESALETNQDLGGELRNANDRVSSLMGDLRNANSQIKELEQEVLRSEEYIDGVDRDLTEHKDTVAKLRHTLQSKNEELQAQRTEIRHLEQAHQKTEGVLDNVKAYVSRLEVDASAAVGQLDSLEDELASAKNEIERLRMVEGDREAKGEQLAKEAERAAELARQMEEALEAAEKRMVEDEEELADLKGKVAALVREKERQRELSTRSIDASRLAAGQVAHEAEIDAMEQELDDANKEIAKLNMMLDQSPARKAIDKAKDTKIEVLEQENEALSERVKALRMTMNDFNTPSKIISNSGISPMHRHALSMSIRTPKTPGAPLREMSWLNSTIADSSSSSPLVSEISRLQRELDRANESIDDKLDKLEDAGLGVVGLTKKLEDARSRIRSLEDEIARLSRREDRRRHRLERARCQKCTTKVDLRNLLHLSENESSLFEGGNDTLPTEPPTPPTKTSEALRANLRSVNAQLKETKKQWEDEQRKLLGEKAVLQDAANRLNAEVNKVSEGQKVASRLRQDAQGDLERARLTIAELENDLKAERSRLRTVSAEQNRVNRDKEQVAVQLKRAESDMEEVRKQLLSCKKENREMENELRVNANIEQKARLLEIKVTENADTMEQLREERSLLAADHKELQQRYSEISERANRLSDQEAASRKSHDKHRHQLDLCLSEIEDLRKALSDRSGELHRVEAEKHRIAAERSDVAQTVAALESDLKRVRESAEAFGRDLKELRLEKERLEREHREEHSKAERTKKQAQTQIRLLNEQLEGQRAKTLRARDDLEKHVCVMDDRQLSALKLQHNKECKGLIVQIRYLKAKFTRESTLRFDLSYQKGYLLALLDKFEKSERNIFAAIATIGFPITPPAQPKKRKFKTIARSVIFLARIKRASEEWRRQAASRQAVAAALEEVHQRRAIASKS